MSFGAFSKRAIGGAFDPGVLTPILIYDHVGIATNQWTPSLDVHGMGTLTGGSGTLTSDWGGSGKPIVNYGSSRVQKYSTYDKHARTWAFVGTIPASPGNGTGPCSTRLTQKMFPMYWSTGSSGTIGTDPWAGADNKALFTSLNAYVGLPFVFCVSIVTHDEIRGHLLIGGNSLAAVNTSGSVQIIGSIVGGFSLGGWIDTGGNWNGGVAAVGAYQSAVQSGAPGAAQLKALAEYWAAQYPGVSF